MRELIPFEFTVLDRGLKALEADRGREIPVFPDGLDPKFDNDNDSGLRLYVVEDTLLVPFQPTLVAHGIAVEVQPGVETQIRPRSSSLFKRRIHVAFGSIDSPYRGELFSSVIYIPEVVRDQQGHLIAQEAPCLLKAGERISQLVVAPVHNWLSIQNTAELSTTARGAGGFGSTGK